MEKVAWVELLSPVLSPVKKIPIKLLKDKFFIFFYLYSKSILKIVLKKFSEKIKF